MSSNSDKKRWRFVNEFTVTEYKCGIRAGSRVRLKLDLVCKDQMDRPTGEVYSAGQIWEVLPTSSVDPVVRLKQADGKLHTWDDAPDFFEYFELVE